MKPQRNGKQKRDFSQGLPAIENNAFNQTIIINNPNFNINYIDHSALSQKPISHHTNKVVQQLPAYDPKSSSKGIDAWSLNKNLKQFSQTRQLGFFKNNGSKARSNSDLQQSPYISHKTKTQDIKPYLKIKAAGTIQATSFRENRTISTIKQKGQSLQPVNIRDRSLVSYVPSQLSTLDPQDESKATFRRRKFEAKPKNSKFSPVEQLQSLQPYLKNQIENNQTIQSLQQTERKITPLNLTSRRNKFTEVQKNNIIKATSRKPNQQQQENLSDIENSLIIGDSSPRKIKTPQSNSTKQYSKLKQKEFQRMLNKVSFLLLSKAEAYFQHKHNYEISSTKIQQYTTTVQQPSSYSYNIDYKSSQGSGGYLGYDFSFEEQRQKARPKTPYKRKKMYEEIG